MCVFESLLCGSSSPLLHVCNLPLYLSLSLPFSPFHFPPPTLLLPPAGLQRSPDPPPSLTFSPPSFLSLPQVSNLPLDDLEAGSLRGTLVGAQLDANVEARQGEL